MEGMKIYHILEFLETANFFQILSMEANAGFEVGKHYASNTEKYPHFGKQELQQLSAHMPNVANGT